MNCWAEPHGKIANKQRLFKAEQFLSVCSFKRLYFGTRINLRFLPVPAGIWTAKCAQLRTDVTGSESHTDERQSVEELKKIRKQCRVNKRRCGNLFPKWMYSMLKRKTVKFFRAP